MTKEEHLNIVYDLFLRGLEDLKERCVPTKKMIASTQPRWFNNHIENALRKQKMSVRK